ncbi:MAG TPA: amidophosphoribosyltransferase, partial [Candidatus Nanoarchaeia archaeon]|nr:amidophosphoribosyltransferase [Candidatus Nanoarchaeia archaeon]
GVKHREGLIKNRYIGRTFIMPTQRERELSVRMKLNPIMSSIQNRRVAVLDDSIVRGTTSRKIVQLLRDAGAKEVHYISTCPPIRNPCHYGIDFPTKEELIASEKTNEEICKEIGADSVTYQTIEDLKEACKIDALCMACLDGKYPSPISQSQMEVLAEQRLCERKE